jgi:hypothetical protein
MEHSFNYAGMAMKRSINIQVSDLIAKLKKWNSPTKQQLVLYCCDTILSFQR